MKLPACSRRGASKREGFTLVEVMIAVTILVIATLSGMGTITTIASLSEANRESTVAYQAARTALERLQSQPFEQVFTSFNASGADDPGGANAAPGMHFTVNGLDPQATDTDGFCGQILLPETSGQLLESRIDPTFSMPRDLNGDGIVDAIDHSADYVVLPVRVQIRWSGKSGDRTVEFATLLSLQ